MFAPMDAQDLQPPLSEPAKKLQLQLPGTARSNIGLRPFVFLSLQVRTAAGGSRQETEGEEFAWLRFMTQVHQTHGKLCG